MKYMAIILTTILLVFQGCTGDHGQNYSLDKETKSNQQVKLQSLRTNNKEQENSELKLLTEFKVGQSKFFSKSDDNNFDLPDYIAIEGNSLVVLNELENKIIKIDIATGKATTNDNLNTIFSSYSELYQGFNNLVIVGDLYFISFLRGIICVSKEGNLISKTPINTNIDFFTVLQDSSFMLFAGNTILHMQKNSPDIKKFEMEKVISGSFLADITNDVVYVSSYSKVKKYYLGEFAKGSEVEEKNLSSLLTDIKYPFLYTITSKYLTWFDHNKKDKLVLLDKETFGKKVVKTIRLDKTIFENNDVPLEDERGGIRITSNNGHLFFTVMKNKTIKIYSLNIE